MISKSPPVRRPPDPAWEHYTLYERVREAIFAVPGNFRSNVVIRGIQATDLFNLNALLGAAIEEGVVDTLNSLRQLWDSGERYAMYSFARQPQTFPDVRLQNAADPSDVLLGIELKGWYLLAKEKEPSFRFLATPAACGHPDLFVVYPWRLSEIISGTPQLTMPYVELARYVAEYRNHHWEFARRHKKSAGIILSSVDRPDGDHGQLHGPGRQPAPVRYRGPPLAKFSEDIHRNRERGAHRGGPGPIGGTGGEGGYSAARDR